MKQFLAAVFLGFCALAATSQARSTAIEERIVAVHEDGSIQLEKSGNAVMSGLVFPDDRASRWLEKKIGEVVKLKITGQDRYGRSQVEGEMQEALLKEGLAIAYDKKEQPEQWLRAEEKGRSKWPKGWVVRAEDTVDHYDKFRVVEGKVLKTYKARDVMYVNFGEDWRQDFSVKIPRRAWKNFGSALDGLEGKKLRVRGTIYNENGPMIELGQPQQMEMIDE